MKKTILVFALLVATLSYGQKMKVSEGSIKNLKGITEFNLDFDYSNLQIPKAKSEEAYLNEKVEMREKKAKGSGEKFRKEWFADREERFEPKFIESFNKRGKPQVDKGSGAKHIMKIHTTKLYPGYNVGIVRHNAEINVEVTITEKASGKVLLKGTYKDVQGASFGGMDYDTGYRISECYAKLAKNIAGYIIKKAK
jgi:hypothetical protein